MRLGGHDKAAIVLIIIREHDIPIRPLQIPIIHHQPQQRVLHIVPLLQFEIHPHDHRILPRLDLRPGDSFQLELDVRGSGRGQGLERGFRLFGVSVRVPRSVQVGPPRRCLAQHAVPHQQVVREVLGFQEPYRLVPRRRPLHRLIHDLIAPVLVRDEPVLPEMVEVLL